jgi:hypothetical protein
VGNDLTKFDVDLTDPNSPKYKEFKHSFETKVSVSKCFTNSYILFSKKIMLLD